MPDIAPELSLETLSTVTVDLDRSEEQSDRNFFDTIISSDANALAALSEGRSE